ncbi:alpha/beta fold hydrolase [Saccharomonospora iraqiensis]|uniref:alpha/beta fold hydrolase n=1 Tax=Saccharomonospora iraqiensis TaxID=52698 RepID=UPI00022E0084|nr:alpha/beta hydrolase [Saccharomonospora iraqiensis]
MSERLPSPLADAVDSRARLRPPLTHVPLSDAPLPSLDGMTGPWPGAEVRVCGGVDGTDVAGSRYDGVLHVRHTPGPGSVREQPGRHPAGGARTAVYVHGLGGSSTNFSDLAGLLSPWAEGHAPDLPGFGFSPPTEGFDFSLRAQADVLADYLTGHCRGPVDLVGNSMGGAVAMMLAAHRPELVRTLTLVSPAVPDRRPDPRRLADPRLPLAYLPLVGRRVRRRLAAMSPRQRAEQVLRLCFADPTLFPEHRLAELIDEHGARASLTWAEEALGRSTTEIFRAWFTPGRGSLWALAPRITVPTLVVWGMRDRVISVRRAPRTARTLPRARLLVLPRTGHLAQMERPTTVARAVLGLWDRADEGNW